MRRTLLSALLVGTAALAGCSNFRDMFSAHANTAAEAAGLELTPKRLSEILWGATKGQRLTQQTAEFLANAWVDYALFAVATTEGKLPTDSASVADAMWAELAELRGTHWHDTLMARRVGPADKAADSAYGAPDVRLFQHILFGAKASATPDVKAASRKKAESALTRIRKGANFGALATQLSEDPGSRADSGFLPPGPRGRFVPAFDSAAWALKPGETTGLVETPFGFHIIKRPALAEVRPRFKDYLAQQAGARLDSMYMDSLASRADIKVASTAPATIRAAMDAPGTARNSSAAIATFKGGSLTTQELMRWIRALPPPYTAQLKTADDSTLRRFTRILTQNVLLLRDADAAGITVSAGEWGDLRQRYFAQLDTLKQEMGLDSSSLGDSSVPAGDRVRAAGLKMDGYFDRLIKGKARLRPLPSALATLLREKLPYKIYDPGVARALELAQAVKPPADTSKAGPGLRRAPGGPPIPGAVPSAPMPADTAALTAPAAKPKSGDSGAAKPK
ncbi:MAG: peptidylprolyl isomerase [Gemmatimonadales bacterium]